VITNRILSDVRGEVGWSRRLRSCWKILFDVRHVPQRLATWLGLKAQPFQSRFSKSQALRVCCRCRSLENSLPNLAKNELRMGYPATDRREPLGSFHGFESGIQRLDFYRRFDKHQSCAAESLILSKNQGQIATDVRIGDGDDRERIGSYIFRDI
jgi:hypothetical protein